MPKAGERSLVMNELPVRELKQNIVSVRMPSHMLKKLAQSRQDREREIVRLENEMQRARVQPESELLVQRYLDRIQRLRDRNLRGFSSARMLSMTEGHNPRLWPGA